MPNETPPKPSVPFFLRNFKNIKGDDGPTDLSTNYKKYFEELLINKYRGKDDKHCLDKDLKS